MAEEGSGTLTSQDARIGLAPRFDVVIDGHDLGGWQQCSGLEVDFSPETVQEMGENSTLHYLPGRAAYQQVTLSRAMVKGNWDNTLNWLARIQTKQAVGNARIALKDAWGDSVAEWSLRNVIPVKWQGPQFDATSTNVAIEKLIFAYEGFDGLSEPEKVTKASLFDEGGNRVDLQFNPQSLSKEQYNTQRGNPAYDRRNGQSVASMQAQTQGASPSNAGGAYGATNYWPCRYNLTNVVFDSEYGPQSLSQSDLVKYLALLFYWMEPQDSTGKPPNLTFKWPNFHDDHVPCNLSESTVTYERLDSQGNPTRVKVNLTLTEVPGTPEGTNPTSGGPGGHRSRLLVAEESLASIAYQEYGDAGVWPLLAKFNGIDDPTRLRSGTSLQVPTMRILERV
jgi:phage tail-like protein